MLPINPSQIPAIYAEALRLQNAGKTGEALQRYSVILGVRPDVPEVHFQLGRIFLTGARPAKAAEHLRIAAGLKPAESAIWSLYGEAVLADADDASARTFLTDAGGGKAPAGLIAKVREKLNPKKSRSTASIGKAPKEDLDRLATFLNAGRFSEAEALGAELCRRHPRVAILFDMLAAAQVQLGNTEAAEASFRKAIALDPNYAEARNNFGRFLMMAGRDDEAEREIRAATRLMPGLVLAHQNLAALLLHKQDNDEAIKSARKAISLNPRSVDTHRILGTLLVRKKDDAGAEEAFETVLRLGGGDAEIHSALGLAQMAQGKDDLAMQHFNRAIELAPEASLTHCRKGLLLQRNGDFAGAEVCLRHALKLDPRNGEYYRYLLTSKKLKADDPLIEQMQTIFDDPETSDTDRRHLGFALSKVMEDTKQHDRVFAYLKTANALIRKEFPYDIGLRRKEIDGIKALYGNVDFDAQAIPGCTDYAPIFVTGMPRSGTTLVEQIIASHSRVTGGGEIGYAAREAYRISVNEKTNQFLSWSQITPSDIAALGQRYAAHMQEQFPDAIQMSDKSIQTYSFMGLIKLAVPKSKMIVVRRDPRDNLLSIFKNVFLEGTHLYAYNLRDLGLYYRMFEELIEFWRERIPGWFYEIQYEDLVANPEVEARKLIEACGLEWEDQCLSFYENKRRVDTLSVFQVRQPIYSSSTKAWERYADELGEMFEALGMAGSNGA